LYFIIWQILLLPITKKLNIHDNFYYIKIQIFYLLPPIVIYFILTKQKILEVLKIKKISLKNLFIIIISSFIVQPIAYVFSRLSELFVKNPTEELIINLFNKSYYLIIISLAILPAILEEIIMRGIVLFNQKNKKTTRACIVNSFLFAFMHFNLQQFLYIFILGFLLCKLKNKTDTILAPIISHFIFNFTQVTMAYIFFKINK
jgi:membrane protease YdiL (CAAX protease family)